MTTSPNPIPARNRIERSTAVLARVVALVVYAYVVVVEVILSLGFFLLLFGANPGSSFVEWIYRNLDRAMQPFRGIFEPVEIGIAGNDIPAIVETSVLFAMVIYAVLAIVLGELLYWLAQRINRIDTDNVRIAERAELEDALARTHGYPDRAAEIEALRQGTSSAGVPRSGRVDS